MHPVRLALVVVFGALATGCDGSSVIGPSKRVDSITITGLDTVRTGLSPSYMVTATLRNGTTRAVTPSWTSSHPEVASVDSDGRLHGRAHGSTNLTAFYEGRTASKTVHLVNNYEGSWTGLYVIKACDQSGFFTGGECENSGRVGQVLPIRLVLSQSGSSQSEVRGTLVLDPFPYAQGMLGWIEQKIAGVVTHDGRLSLDGASNIQAWDNTLTFQVGGWETNLSRPGEMTGRWTQNLTMFHFAGHMYQENELVTLTGGFGQSPQSSR